MTERDVIEEIVDSYLLVLGLQEKVATVNAALALLDSLDRVVKAGEKAGVLEPTDALRLELKKNEIRAKQLQLKNGIELASRLLCLQAGLDYPAEGLTLAPVDDVLPTNAVGPRPELRLLQLNIDAQRLRRRLTIGETLPTIGMGWILNYGNLFKNGTAYQMLSGKVSEFNANAIFLPGFRFLLPTGGRPDIRFASIILPSSRQKSAKTTYCRRCSCKKIRPVPI